MEKIAMPYPLKRKYREAVERLPSTLPRKSVVVATTVVLSFLEKDLERTSLKKNSYFTRNKYKWKKKN